MGPLFEYCLIRLVNGAMIYIDTEHFAVLFHDNTLRFYANNDEKAYNIPWHMIAYAGHTLVSAEEISKGNPGWDFGDGENCPELMAVDVRTLLSLGGPRYCMIDELHKRIF